MAAQSITDARCVAELEGGIPLIVRMSEYTLERCEVGLKSCARGRHYEGTYCEEMTGVLPPSPLSGNFRLETCYVDQDGKPIVPSMVATTAPGEREPRRDPVEPIRPLLAGASIDAGMARARICRVCHTFEKDEPNRIGPNLHDVVGKPIARDRDGYRFSEALAARRNEIWTIENLNLWLARPSSFARRTKMTFAGFLSARPKFSLADLTSA
jgi:cytochrome c2